MRPPLELRERPNGLLNLTGWASVFNVEYYIGGGQYEVIKPGAFARCLSEDPETILRVEHRGIPLASTRAKAGKEPTLRLSEDRSTGLYMDADLNPKDPRVNELRAASDHVPLQASFAFTATGEKWDADYVKREVTGASIHEGDVAICGYGANPETSVDIRSGESTLEERRAAAENIGRRVFGPAAWVPFGGDMRSGYAAHELSILGGEGKAYPNPDGHWSFPTATRADYDKAVKVVQLAGASKNKVRLYLMGRAKKEGWPIPVNWSSDGSARANVVLPDFTTTASQQLEVMRAGRPRRAVGTRSTLAATSARQEAELAALRRVNR